MKRIDEQQNVRWTTIFKKETLDDDKTITIESLREEALELLRNEDNKAFPFLLFDYRYGMKKHQWFSEFYNEELETLLFSRIHSTEMDWDKIEDYITLLKKLDKYPTESRELYVQLCMNRDVRRYCKHDPDNVLKNTLKKLLNTHLYVSPNSSLISFIIGVFEKNIPEVIHPIIAPELSEALDSTNASTVFSALMLIDLCQGIMTLEHFSVELMLKVFRIEKYRYFCCRALRRLRDLMLKVSENDPVAVELFEELCKYSFLEDTDFQGFYTLAHQLKNVTDLNIDPNNCHNILSIIEPFITKLFSEEHRQDNEAMVKLLSSYVDVKCYCAHLSQFDVNELDGVMLQIVMNQNVRDSLLHTEDIPKIVSAFIKHPDGLQTQCFTVGVQYGLDTVLNTIEYLHNSSNQPTYLDCIELPHRLKKIYAFIEIFLDERTLKWILLNQNQKLRLICDKFISCNVSNNQLPLRAMLSAFELIDGIIILDQWEILVRENEALCEFIIRYMLSVQENLKRRSLLEENTVHDTTSLALLLARINVHLSQSDKDKIYQAIDLSNLFQLVVNSLEYSGTSNFGTMLLVQLYFLSDQTLKDAIFIKVHLLEDELFRDIESLFYEELFYVANSITDMYLEMKPRMGNCMDGVRSYLEEWIDDFEREEWDVQSLLSRYHKLKAE
jgi:hypothetical protein